MTPLQCFFWENAPYVEDLHPFRKIGICYIPNLGYNRTNNRGRIGLYLNLPINHPLHTFKFFNPCTKKVFTSRNVTWTGLTWGEYKKINLENYFYKTVVALDSNKENEVKRTINVQGPNNIQRERLVEALNINNKETGDFNSGRAIRGDPLQLNINILENFDNLNDNTIYTPRYC